MKGEKVAEEYGTGTVVKQVTRKPNVYNPVLRIHAQNVQYSM